MRNPVTVKEIKITKSTAELTGFTSYEELMSNERMLFKTISDKDLITLYKQIDKKESRFDISKLSKNEKIEACKNALTFQIKLHQAVPKPDITEVIVNNNLGFFLSGRSGISEGKGKIFYQTCDLKFIKDNNIELESNLSEVFSKKDMLIHLLRLNSFTPDIDKSGLITTAPKSMGKGGVILTKENKLIFMKTVLVISNSLNIEEDSDALEAKEIKNIKEFEHDGIIEEYPSFTREGLFFDEDSQSWLQEEYQERNLGMFKRV